MQSWSTDVLVGGRKNLNLRDVSLNSRSGSLNAFQPRQFEYHPTVENLMVFGTLRGEAVVVNTESKQVIQNFQNGLSKDSSDALLGLCWYRRHPNHFISGSSRGILRTCCIRPENEDNAGGELTEDFPSFEKLTSVHINSDDSMLLASGYSYNVRLYDIQTGQAIRDLVDIHNDHINISRFAHFSPHLFATSSFDCTVKMWDSRLATHAVWNQTMDEGGGEDSAATPKPRPLYTCSSSKGHVMVCFSPDDSHLLTSAVDNEITEFLALDGRRHLTLDIERCGLEDNFTRAYYTCSGRLILSGSSEEQVMRVHCARTGQLVEEAEMYPHRRHPSLYIQSLRGDPFNDYKFSVLVNYRDPAFPLEIVKVDMSSGRNGEDISTWYGSAIGMHSSASLKKTLHKSLLAENQSVLNELQCTQHTQLSFPDEMEAYHTSDTVFSCLAPGALPLCKGADEEKQGPGSGGNSGVSSPRWVTFRAHAAILAARCKAFKPQLQAAALAPVVNEEDGVSHAGVRRRRSCHITLPEQIDAEAFMAVLEYLYTDHIFGEDRSKRKEADVDLEENSESPKSSWNAPTALGRLWRIEKLAQAALALNLPRLHSLAIAACKKMISIETVITALQMAERMQAPDLKNYCEYYLAIHFDILRAGNAEIDPGLKQKVEKMRCAMILNIDNEEKMPDSLETDLGDEVSLPRPGSPLAAIMGHTLMPVLDGSVVLVLGGGNTHQFHSLKHIPVFNPITECWGKVSTRGDIPVALIYHTSTPLESDGPENILIYGGSHHHSSSEPGDRSDPAWVLNCRKLMWTRVAMSGESPELRTRHSMAALYPPMCEGTDRSEAFPYHRPHLVRAPDELYTRDAHVDVNLVLFGGYSHRMGQALNDVHLLNCHWAENGQLQCLWLPHAVSGTAPAPRLAHGAAMLDLPEDVGGARMVVFGGVGINNLHNDLASLRCSDLSHLVWEEVESLGTAPSPRYGHSMVQLAEQKQIVVHGGTAMQETLDDFYVLEFQEVNAQNRLVFNWFKIQVSGDVLPSPRTRHGACALGQTGVMMVLGGSNEYLAQEEGEEEEGTWHQSKSVETQMHCLVPPSQHQETKGSRHQWLWRKCCSQMIDPGNEPPIMIQPSCFFQDMQSLVDSSTFADLSFGFQVGLPPETEVLLAHKMMVVARSLPMRAMLNSGMKETLTGSVEVFDIRKSIFKVLINFLYTDTLQCIDDDLLEIIVASNRYGLDGLVALCEGYLHSELDVDNACSLYKYADMVSLPSLKMTVLSFLMRNYDKVSATEGWESLPSELLHDIEDFRATQVHLYMRDQPDHALLGGTPTKRLPHRGSADNHLGSLEGIMANAG